MGGWGPGMEERSAVYATIRPDAHLIEESDVCRGRGRAFVDEAHHGAIRKPAHPRRVWVRGETMTQWGASRPRPSEV